MESEAAILALAALAQQTRLEVFRLLVKHEPAGLPSGEVARHLAVPQNTMSSHLGTLTRAGLVRNERQSRSIIYRANLETAQRLVTFLLNDCCAGRPEICALVVQAISGCCSPASAPTGIKEAAPVTD